MLTKRYNNISLHASEYDLIFLDIDDVRVLLIYFA